MIGEKTTTIQRLEALFDSLMADKKLAIPKPFIPVANKLVKNFLASADESELHKIIIDIRDNVIPWLLGNKEL